MNNSHLSANDHVFLHKDALESILVEFDGSNSKFPVIVICGEPGIGKTHLANEAISELGKKNAELRIVFVSFRLNKSGTEENNVLSDMYRQISDGLGREDINRWPIEEQYDKVLKALAQKPTVLVLDNLDKFRDSPLRILDLLEHLPPNTRAIVTSRDWDYENTEFYRRIQLITLSKEDFDRLAAYVFDSLATRKSEAITDEQKNVLWEAVTPNPLAIELSVARMSQALKQGQLESSNSEDLRQFLNPKKSSGRIGLEDAISLAIDAVDDLDEHNLLLSFGLFWGDADSEALASVAGLPSLEISKTASIQLLRKVVHLAHLKLIKKAKTDSGQDIEGSRPKVVNVVSAKVVKNEIRLELLNPSIGDVIRSRLKQDSSLEIKLRGRWINFYKTLRDDDKESGWTIFTDYLIKSEKFRDGRNFKPEMPNILQAIDYCLVTDSRNHWRDAAKMVDDFRESFFSLGFWEEREKFCLKILDMNPENSMDLAIRARTYRLLAWIKCFQSQFDKAKAITDLALALVAEGLSKVSEDLSSAKEGSLKKRECEDLRDRWRQTAYKLHDTLGQIALRKLTPNSSLKEINKNLQNAQKHFSEALLIVSRNWPNELLAVQSHLGEVKYEYAKNEQRRANRLFDEYRYKDARKQWQDSAKPLWSEVRDIYETILDKARSVSGEHLRAEAHALYYLGKISRRGQDPTEPQKFDEAKRYFSESEAIADLYGDRVLKARIIFAKGQLEFAAKNLESSTTLIKQAYIELFRFRMLREYEDAANFMKLRLQIKEEEISDLTKNQTSEESSTKTNKSSAKIVIANQEGLKSLIDNKFSLKDLSNELMFPMGIDPEHVTSDTVAKPTVLAGLIIYIKTRGKPDELLKQLNAVRPNVDPPWESFFGKN